MHARAHHESGKSARAILETATLLQSAILRRQWEMILLSVSRSIYCGVFFVEKRQTSCANIIAILRGLKPVHVISNQLNHKRDQQSYFLDFQFFSASFLNCKLAWILIGKGNVFVAAITWRASYTPACWKSSFNRFAEGSTREGSWDVASLITANNSSGETSVAIFFYDSSY